MGPKIDANTTQNVSVLPQKRFDDLKFYKTVFIQLGKHILILCLVFFELKTTILLSKNLGAKKGQQIAIFGPFWGRKSRPMRLKMPPFCQKKSFDTLKFYKTVFNQVVKHILILCLVYFGQKATILEPFCLSALTTKIMGGGLFFLPGIKNI